MAFVSSLLVGVAACGDDNDTARGDGEPVAGGGNTLAITERDYAFDVEGNLNAGTVSIAVTNQGAEFHEIAIAKLTDGKTVDDARAALEASTDDDEDPLEGITEDDDVIDDLGGVQLPGTSYTVTGSGIEPGDYLLLCFIPNAEGQLHVSLGMVAGFTVADGDTSAAEPADVTYTATNDALDGPTTLDAGQTTIEIANDTAAEREIWLMKTKAGNTDEDVATWFESSEEGAPDPSTAPLDFLAFVFDGEQDRTLTVELTPGQWTIRSSDPENPFEGPPTEDPHTIAVTVS